MTFTINTNPRAVAAAVDGLPDPLPKLDTGPCGLEYLARFLVLAFFSWGAAQAILGTL